MEKLYITQILNPNAEIAEAPKTTMFSALNEEHEKGRKELSALFARAAERIDYSKARMMEEEMNAKIEAETEKIRAEYQSRYGTKDWNKSIADDAMRGLAIRIGAEAERRHMEHIARISGR